jgi:predicted HicB family RNase H-like nuclease
MPTASKKAPEPKRGRGRPPLESPRDRQVNARLTAAEEAACVEAARREGKSMTRWVRDTLLLRAYSHG